MKSNFKLGNLFRNNKFLIVISVIISIIVWINLSLSNDNESTTTISNIPIQINLSDEAVDNGLQIFSGDDQTASVTVSGNRVALGSTTSDDIVVSAQTAGTITRSGTYPLSLTASKVDSSDNFEITSSVSPSVITIFVDYARKTSFDIENKIKYSVADGYHADVTLSYDKVTIQGPQTEMSKIASVAIEGNISGELTESTELECDIKLYDSSGSELTDNMFTFNHDTIVAAISVNPIKEVPLKASFSNKPSGLDIDSLISISPSSILVSGGSDVLDELESISTEKIDFTTLNNKESTLKLNIDLPDDCINLNDTDTARVTIDLSDYSSKKFQVGNFTVSGLDSSYSYQVNTESLTVKIKGEKSDLQDISSSDITCVIDASSIEGTTGSISLPVKIKIKGNNSCWAYGEYKANVIISES